MNREMNSNNGKQEDFTRAEILVIGDVQEAGYRGTILPIARRHKLKGFVENSPEGTVKIIAEGQKETVKRFIQEIDIRNGVVEVEKIEVKFCEPTGEFKWFKVKYDDMVSEIFQGFGTAKKYFGRIGDKVDRVADLVVQGNEELKKEVSFVRGEISQFRQESSENFQKLGNEISEFRQDSNANFESLDEKYHTVSDELKGIRQVLEKRLSIEEEKVKYSAEKKDVSGKEFHRGGAKDAETTRR